MSYLARDFERNPQARYGVTTNAVSGLGMGATVIWENVNYAGSKA